MRKNAFRLAVGTAVAALMVAVGSTGAMASVDTSRQSRTIVGVGSDNIYEVMNDLDQLYNESPGCAVLPPNGTAFTNYQETCIDPGTLSYSTDYTDLITSENLYHDRVTEAFPVGSTNGRLILTQAVSGNPTIQADFARSSSKQTYATVPNYTPYGVAFARGGVSYWVGKSNSSVFQNTAGVPAPNLTISDMKLIWVGDSGGACGINWSNNSGDSLGGATGTPGSGSITVFATQPGSGTGLGFLRLINPGVSYSDASALQNCIPAQYKDGTGNDDHVIFENNAAPICNVQGGPFRSSAIFPYEYARFVQNNGGASLCSGVLGKVANVKPTVTSIGKLPGTTGAFPMGSYRYLYFEVPSGVDVNDPTTWTGNLQSVLEYMHPTLGWLCKPSGSHAIDPISGSNYRTLIESTLTKDGFAPLTSGPVGGSTFSGTSYCRDAAST